MNHTSKASVQYLVDMQKAWRRQCPKKKTLLSEFPTIATQWNYEKNGDLVPDDVPSHFHKKVWWKCEKGHTWEATPANRVQGKGCPYCSGRMAIPGETDLATQYPVLVMEWHPTKNGTLTPDRVKPGSKKKVWWLCSVCSCEWEATIGSRTHGAGCPFCSGHRAIPGETDLAKLYPEVAAGWHPTKNGDLKPNQVRPGSHKEVFWLCGKGHEWKASVKERTRGNGCPYCAGKRAIPGETDLATLRPDLTAEWHPVKNGTLTPNQVTRGSNKKVFWRCSFGHEWQAAVCSRTKGSGCPYCARRKAVSEKSVAAQKPGKAHGQGSAKKSTSKRSISRIIPGKNDFATLYPEVAAQWHPTKNGDLTPEQVTPGTERIVYWQCENGHEWQASVYNRCKGQRCPVCIGRKIVPGVNSLMVYYPELAAQWHPTKNGSQHPDEVSPRTTKKAWWLCPICDYEWEATIFSRTDGCGCPRCAGKILVPGHTFGDVYPRLAAQWHPTLNGDLKPTDVFPKTKRKVWWLCSVCGQTWNASVAGRSVSGNDLAEGETRCPFCTRRRVVPGETDLASSRPDLAAQWNWEKNGDLTPADVSVRSHRMAWWRCKEGHAWKSMVKDRTAGTGCPYCVGKRPIPGENDLATLYPEIAAEWHPTKNGNLTPDQLMPKSGKKVWWVCKQGHEWAAVVGARVNGSGCPICIGRMPSIL